MSYYLELSYCDLDCEDEIMTSCEEDDDPETCEFEALLPLACDEDC
jgi:hypothetical protein